MEDPRNFDYSSWWKEPIPKYRPKWWLPIVLALLVAAVIGGIVKLANA